MSGSAADSDIAATVATMSRVDDRFELRGVDGWLQGRTMYGGASSYLAYAAVRSAMPGLPPLRGAQIGFVAPVGEDLDITVSVLREGRSVSQIQTDLFSDGVLAHRGLWLFGSARPSNGIVASHVVDDLMPYADAKPALSPAGLHFIHKFDIRRAEPEGAPAGVIRRWVRLKARGGLDPMGELVLIGDALPPGSLREMEREGPISSINWSFSLLGDTPTTHDGWWLLETTSNHMADGFSSETLRMWNTDGVEVMRGLQSVAIFG